MVLDASLLNTQHYKVRIKGKVEPSREGVAPSPTSWCSSYRKGSLRVTLDYGRQLYLLTSPKEDIDCVFQDQPAGDIYPLSRRRIWHKVILMRRAIHESRILPSCHKECVISSVFSHKECLRCHAINSAPQNRYCLASLTKCSIPPNQYTPGRMSYCVCLKAETAVLKGLSICQIN